MVITMGLTQLPEFRSGEWQHHALLANRDMTSLKSLTKYLNVGNNMSYYRTAFKKAAKAPCLPFFPIIMKDLTFLMDGNSTKRSDGLINFTKFRVLMNSIHTLLYYTMENYYFASDLTSFPFFPDYYTNINTTTFQDTTNSLDHVASIIESLINNSTTCQEEK